MKVVVYEDGKVPQLDPVTLARPAYAITCGGYRLIDWLTGLEQPLFASVRPHLQEIQQVDYPVLPVERLAATEWILLVNARLVPSVETHRVLTGLIAARQAGCIRGDGPFAAALVPGSLELPPLPWTGERMRTVCDAVATFPAVEQTLSLLEYPHDVVRYNMQTLGENLEHRLAHGEYREIRDGVFAAPGVQLGEHCVTQTRSGPIVVEPAATIGPFCYLSGPALIGRGAKLIEHAAIKDAVSVGHTTKIGGEVEASVIEPYTNKQHHGFLGHSYLGSWINLGAGTCNSDLKNTYGRVNMDYGGERVATGMQFVGCMMGDYAKTAINTGIFTGKTVGVCSMIYGFVTANVPSFVNYARLFGQVTELPPEIMIQTQERMFRRRHVVQRPCDIQLIHDMYELTRDERQLAGEPLAF